MRILNVRLKNLNSLLGEWRIDFTDPAYTSDGIFVITGPTGAGKTTILDAVCLALYGRTPRLRDVNQGANEIMSRQAGECFAEVTFETNIGRYRAFWGQHRSRKRPDGALQQQRHELADAASGVILETKQREVADRIKETTGLSFEQFTRSILLAQGDFAAFLQCAPGERSPILEQITGTEIYSQLSIRTHEIRNAEKAELNIIEAEAAAFRGMDPDERKALESKLESLRLEEARAGKELELRGAECDWLTNIASLQKELDALEDRRTDLARRREGFEAERARLARAQRALEFGSAHAALVTFRREQEAEKHALSDCHVKLPEFEAGVRRSEDELQTAVSASSDRQADKKKLLPVLRKVRELDLKYQEKDAPTAELQEAAEELAATIAAQKERLEAERLKFEAAQVNMRDVRKFLQNNAADEKLIERIAGIKTRFETLESFTVKRRKLGDERAAAEKTKETTQKRLDRQSLLYDTAKTKFTSMESSVKKQTGALGEIRGSRPIGEWRELLTNLAERKTRLGQVEETLKGRAEIAAARQELKDKKSGLDFSINECLKKISGRQDKIHALEKELDYLSVQAELVLRIKSMEEARGRLEDGRPCPLCGSTSHPFSAGSDSIPQDDEVQLRVRRVKESLKNENAALSALNMDSARLTGEAMRADEDDARLHVRIQEVERRLTEDLTALQLPLSIDADALAAVSRERQRAEEQLQKTRLVVERVEKGEDALRVMRDELEHARQDSEQFAVLRQEAEFENETASRDIVRLARDIRLADDELKNIRLDLTRQVIPFGFKNLPEDNPEQVLDALSARLAKWQEQNNIRTELEKRISVWERDLHHERSVLDNFTAELKDKNDAVKKLKAEKNALGQQRVSLFGEKDPDREEARQTALAEAAEQQVEAKREARAAAQQDLSNMRSKIDDLVKSIHVRADSLQKTELSFKKQLIASDFANEDAYLSACLPEAERKVLQDRASALDMEQVELEALHLDRKFALDELRRRHVSDLPPEEAAERKAQAAARLKELQQSIGALAVKLEEEEGLSQKRAGLAERLGKQREEFRRWEDLHGLIGSADGQKYRNFVQELTFEMVIRNANRQLQKMMDRYFLVKDDAAPLSLSVVDNYQAGSLRSAKNLSGGESFIVSLALALGLSQMASQKVRVDSLFLDEGFGTLDEEALDMALSTLTALRREGKLIGIISHVEALKERIAAQIEVIPQGGGVSTIKAPGCTGNTN